MMHQLAETPQGRVLRVDPRQFDSELFGYLSWLAQADNERFCAPRLATIRKALRYPCAPQGFIRWRLSCLVREGLIVSASRNVSVKLVRGYIVRGSDQPQCIEFRLTSEDVAFLVACGVQVDPEDPGVEVRTRRVRFGTRGGGEGLAENPDHRATATR
jgi:hypothetical protein